MPKLKTNRAAAKRFKFTGTGKVRRARAFVNHILSKKSTKRKRNLRQGAIVCKSEKGGLQFDRDSCLFDGVLGQKRPHAFFRQSGLFLR